MKKFFTLAFFVCALAAWAGAAWAQAPNPEDTVFLESKAVPDTAYPNATDTAAVVYMKVWITNRDTLTAFVLALKETSLCCGAYLTLGRPRNFNGVVSSLTSTLQGSKILNAIPYHSNNPDSFSVVGLYDPLDDLTKEPPNAARKAFYEIKFDTARIDIGLNGDVEFDTVRVAGQPTGFANTQPVDQKVNFMKSIITITRTDVRDVNQGQRPQSYSLSQNYPNPFNANTQISFALPKSGKATLEIFNILGQKVNTLVDGYMEAGYKIVNWDGRDNRGMEAPSGIYFYRLRSKDFLQTKKMLMIQ